MMAGMVYACVAPHGYDIIDEIAGPMREKFRVTRQAMEQLGHRLKQQSPDIIVVLTPHGTRIEAYTSIATNEFAKGSLTQHGVTVNLSAACDREFAFALINRAKEEHLHVIRYVYGSESGSFSVLPLDWGAFIPLWYVLDQKEEGPRIVVISPTRDQPVDELVELGRQIAQLAQDSGKRVALIASADQGHAHDENGPYGYHPASAEYDELVRQAINENQLASLLELPMSLVDEAKPDSLWQLAVLHGVMQKVPLKGEVLSYEVPTYFGVLCASFQKVE